MPQESILGPLLFILFISDMTSSHYCYIYAVDMLAVIFDLNRLWAKTDVLPLNVGKS